MLCTPLLQRSIYLSSHLRRKWYESQLLLFSVDFWTECPSMKEIKSYMKHCLSKNGIKRIVLTLNERTPSQYSTNCLECFTKKINFNLIQLSPTALWTRTSAYIDRGTIEHLKGSGASTSDFMRKIGTVLVWTNLDQDILLRPVRSLCNMLFNCKSWTAVRPYHMCAVVGPGFKRVNIKQHYRKLPLGK